MSQYGRGEFVFHRGDEAISIFLLFEGMVKVTFSSLSGEEKIISIFQPDDIFGELFLGKYNRRIGTAITLEKSSVGRITKPNLLHLLTNFPIISQNFISHLVDEQREMLARMHVLMHVDARHRLMGILLSLARRVCCPDRDWLELPACITQSDIANIACLNRSTVNIHINALRIQGILGGKGHKITINRAAIEAELRSAGLEILE